MSPNLAPTPSAESAPRRSAWILTHRLWCATNPTMPVSLPICPFLPTPRSGLDWRALNVHRDSGRGAEFYRDCLEYGHSLWQRGFAARAVLCLDRAMGADLSEHEPILGEWPLPYDAVAWMISRTPPEVFVGNPRVHFQHYADRMNEPRRNQRRWRAWACWALVRVVRPEFPADPRHCVIEPTEDEIENALCMHGHLGEAQLWRKTMCSAAP